jgi:hypothetical protein
VAENFCQQDIIKTAYWDRLLGRGVTANTLSVWKIIMTGFLIGTTTETVSLTPHRCKGNGLFVSFGEHQGMAQLIAKRVLISPLINKDFPVLHPFLARAILLP